MGTTFSSSVKQPPIIGRCTIPSYCLRSLGSRHVLVAGGGGAAKTGVGNEIKLYLLTYNQLTNEKSPTEKRSANQLMATQTDAINTSPYANNNMDIIALGAPETGNYLVAVGQDQYCAFYRTTGFALTDQQQQGQAPSQLSLEFQSLLRIETDQHADDPHQESVCFFRSEKSNAILVVTGGYDGHCRIWSLSQVLEVADPVPSMQQGVPELGRLQSVMEFRAAGVAIDVLRVSRCGAIIATVAKGNATFWNAERGERLVDLPALPQQGDELKVRSLQFLNLGDPSRNAIFATTHIRRSKTSKNEVTYLSVWAYSREKGRLHIISSKLACKETTSCLSASKCGNFIAIGTLTGSVGIFNTHDLSRPLHFAAGVHEHFVTDIDFLPHRSYDNRDLGRIESRGAGPEEHNKTMTTTTAAAGKCFLPGVCSDSRCAVISLSVDQTIQLHKVPFPRTATVTGSLLKMAVRAILLYLVFLWLLFAVEVV